MARDIIASSASELIRLFDNIIVMFKERQNICNSALHIMEVMDVAFPLRCLLELGTDELQETSDVYREHGAL